MKGVRQHWRKATVAVFLAAAGVLFFSKSFADSRGFPDSSDCSRIGGSPSSGLERDGRRINGGNSPSSRRRPADPRQHRLTLAAWEPRQRPRTTVRAAATTAAHASMRPAATTTAAAAAATTTTTPRTHARPAATVRTSTGPAGAPSSTALTSGTMGAVKKTEGSPVTTTAAAVTVTRAQARPAATLTTAWTSVGSVGVPSTGTLTSGRPERLPEEDPKIDRGMAGLGGLCDLEADGTALAAGTTCAGSLAVPSGADGVPRDPVDPPLDARSVTGTLCTGATGSAAGSLGPGSALASVATGAYSPGDVLEVNLPLEALESDREHDVLTVEAVEELRAARRWKREAKKRRRSNVCWRRWRSLDRPCFPLNGEPLDKATDL